MEIAIAKSPSDRQKCFDLRMTVFVHEQHVPEELEMDDLDAGAIHFLATVDGDPIGTARLLDYVDHGKRVAKIGRVAVLADHRRCGAGAAIMDTVMAQAREMGYKEALLDAQTYIIPFYQRLGFIAEGEEFLDAGIPHYRMRRAL